MARAPSKGEIAPSVLLVSMPWTTLTEPSAGLGLLRAVLDRQGISCRVLHLNLFLLEHLQALTYKEIANMWALNDFLFSGVLDRSLTNRQERTLRWKARELLNRGRLDSRRLGGTEGTVEALLRLRAELVPGWLEKWADEIAGYGATLIGFSCMYDQTIASLALAKMLRDRSPGTLLALGGYAVRSPTAEMILRSSPWIDAICNGEGEITVAGLAKASAGEIPLLEVPGVTARSAVGDIVTTAPPPRVDLSTNPVPNYGDFFADIQRLSAEYQVDVLPQVVPIENSRGCWWGAKSHCVFCGIHDEDMAYRARRAERVIESMATLHQRHDIDYFRFSDYIFPIQYYKTLLPELEQSGSSYRLSGEMKANVSEEKFALMAKAGFKEVQPGIESFNTRVLEQMDKGVSALQNIYTLLLGRRHGVRVLYNLLYYFPGDEEADYEEMAALLPRLLHLDAPVTCQPVQITRYAPLQASPERFAVEPGRFEYSYELVFSREYLRRTGFDLDDYCYYFERTFVNSTHLQRLYARIEKTVDGWRALAAAKKAWLYEDSSLGDEGTWVRDRRGSEEVLHQLDEIQTRVLRACAAPTSYKRLEDEARLGVDRRRISLAIEELEAVGLLYREESRVLSLLAVAPEHYAPEVVVRIPRQESWCRPTSEAFP